MAIILRGVTFSDSKQSS